jgi:hypothetical protein
LRGRLGSSGVRTVKTDESIERNFPPGLVLLKISAAGHPECDGRVSGDLVHQVDAIVIRAGRLGEVAFGQERAGVREGVGLQRETFPEPCLELGILRVDPIRHDADRRPAIDRFQPVEDGPQIGFVAGGLPHIVDRQHNDRLDARFADPLRCDQLGKVAVRVIGTHLVEIREAVGLGRCGAGGNAWKHGE